MVSFAEFSLGVAAGTDRRTEFLCCSMNLSTSGSNPSEDEDEDCVVTLVKSGKSNSSIPITDRKSVV